MKRLDLTGQVFGRLTALYPLEERKAGRTCWRCRCTCGNEVDVQTTLLMHGGTQSCGCLRDKHKKDITGMRFGMLTAVYPTEKRQQNRVVWHCRCDCGGERDVMISTFLSGKVTSCGCQNKNNLEDLTGRRFGKLVVISKTDRRNHTDRYWLCRCDCGTEKEVLGRSLRQGATQSCGCSRYNDFTGMKRGKLTAILKTGRVINRSPEYLWRCECGNEILLPVSKVPKKGNRMCPECLRKQNGEGVKVAHKARAEASIDGVPAKTLKGIKEGRLTALNTSGIRGVWRNGERWSAGGLVNGKTMTLGTFDTKEEAKKARDAFVAKRYGRAFDILEERENG